MRRHLNAVIIVVFILGAVAHADKWKKTYSVSGIPKLRLEAPQANVRIRGWNRSEISAQVFTDGWRISPSQVRILERQTANQLNISVHIPAAYVTSGPHSVRVELMVPRQCNLDVYTGDGNIAAATLAGASHLKTEVGTIEISGYEGVLQATTGSGHIRLQGRFDTLELHTGAGTIEAAAAPGSRMMKPWSLGTGRGHVVLRLPADFAADLTAHTISGRIFLDYPASIDGSVSQSEVRAKMNGGGESLELRTVVGNIVLRRS